MNTSYTFRADLQLRYLHILNSGANYPRLKEKCYEILYYTNTLDHDLS